MIVQKSRLLLDDDEARIVASVRSEAGNFTPFELVIGVPRAYVGWLDLTGNPFVPTLLLLAGVLGERLRLEGTVSPLLLSNTQKACELFRSWWGIAPVPVEAEAAIDRDGVPAKGTLFSSRAEWTRGIPLCATGPTNSRDVSPISCMLPTWIGSIRRRPVDGPSP